MVQLFFVIKRSVRLSVRNILSGIKKVRTFILKISVRIYINV